jgi:hypothetical protein
MISKSKLALIAAVAAIGIASPVLAQSRDSGRDLFDVAPSNVAASTVYDPAATGGGSIGYNESQTTNQW